MTKRRRVKPGCQTQASVLPRSQLTTQATKLLILPGPSAPPLHQLASVLLDVSLLTAKAKIPAGNPSLFLGGVTSPACLKHSFVKNTPSFPRCPCRTGKNRLEAREAAVLKSHVGPNNQRIFPKFVNGGTGPGCPVMTRS